MPGALLQSGLIKEYKPLGTAGQPVYSSAGQLREAVRLRLGKGIAQSLAIPRSNESGDTVDWYAPVEGDVIPWSAASVEEREEAYQSLEHVQEQLKSLSGSLLGVEESSREQKLFAQLLGKSIHFPGDDNVFLVLPREGSTHGVVAVVTFWGFTDQEERYVHDPLLCLRPPIKSEPIVEVEPEPEIVTPPVVAAPLPWWRRWWWLLPLLLFLLALLALYLLRGCSVDGYRIPVFGGDERPASEVIEELPHLDRIPDGSQRWLDRVASGATEQHDAGGALPSDGVSWPDAGAMEEPPGDMPVLGSEETDARPHMDADIQPVTDVPSLLPPESASIADQPATGSPPSVGDPLVIPPDAMSEGSTSFLNGRWRAGAGIQDARTGRPVQLDYQFSDGQGQVRVSGREGVECVGQVDATIADGALAINNRSRARCNDGSYYEMPEVRCSTDAGGQADCTGTYDDMSFPMSMRERNP